MNEERKGELFIFAENFLWALFPVVTVLSLSHFAPLLNLAFTTALSVFFFAGIMLYRGSWRELSNPLVWRYGFLIALFIGVGFYGFYFTGLLYTAPGNAAIIALFEVLTTYVLFNIIRREAFPLSHKVGAALMIMGACIVLSRNFAGFAVGDFLVLAGTFFSPFGNMYMQKCREIASSETIMFLRSGFSALIMGALGLALGETVSKEVFVSALPWLLINGIAIFGISKLFWIEGIHRVSVTKAIVLQSVAPLLTLLFAWLILAQAPTVWQLSSILPFFLGVLLLTGSIKLPKGATPLGG